MAYNQRFFDEMIMNKNRSESEQSPLKNVPQYFSDIYYKEKLHGNRDPLTHQSFKGCYKDYLENSRFRTAAKQSLLSDKQSAALKKNIDRSLNESLNNNYQYNNNRYYDIQNNYIPDRNRNEYSLNSVSSEDNFRKIWANNKSKYDEKPNYHEVYGMLGRMNSTNIISNNMSNNIMNHEDNASNYNNLINNGRRSRGNIPDSNSNFADNNYNNYTNQIENLNPLTILNTSDKNNNQLSKSVFIPSKNDLYKDYQIFKQENLNYNSQSPNVNNINNSNNTRSNRLNNFNTTNIIGNIPDKYNKYESEYSNYRQYDKYDNCNDDYLKNKLEGYGRNVISPPDKDYKRFFNVKANISQQQKTMQDLIGRNNLGNNDLYYGSDRY